MREQAVFETDDKHERKLQTLRRVDRHQRYGRVAFVIVLIGNERRVIDKLTQSIDALVVVINRGVYQFLQVFEPSFGFFSLLGSERVFVTRLDNRGADDV